MIKATSELRVQDSSFVRISKPFLHLRSGVLIFLFILPLSAITQTIANFGASSPLAVKDLGNGDRLVVCRRAFGGSSNDSLHLETGIAGSDWMIAPVTKKRLEVPGTWNYSSSYQTLDGLLMNGILYTSGANRASLLRLTDAGETIWFNRYDGVARFSAALPSGDSTVAFAAGVGSQLFRRVVIGSDGSVLGGISISGIQGHEWQIISACTTSVPEEHVIAGANIQGTFSSAWIARVGPSGVIWMNVYYPPLSIASSLISSIVPAQDGGYTCTMNVYDNQLPGISNTAYLMHVDDNGDVVWCRGPGLMNPGIDLKGLYQLPDGDYVAIRSWDTATEEITRFSSTGDPIARSTCQAPCNMHSLGRFTGSDFPEWCMIIGQNIAELDVNGVPCGRSFAPSGGFPSVSITSTPLTTVVVTSPTITAVPIPLSDRAPELSATTSCGTTITSSAEKPMDQLRVFPVPAVGRITVELNRTPPSPVVILDHSGRVVLRVFAPCELDISSLAPGPYECKVLGTNLHARFMVL